MGIEPTMIVLQTKDLPLVYPCETLGSALGCLRDDPQRRLLGRLFANEASLALLRPLFEAAIFWCGRRESNSHGLSSTRV